MATNITVSKRKFIVVLTGTALAGALLTYFLILQPSKAVAQISPNTKAVRISERISWDKAERLMNEYLDFEPLRVRHWGESGREEEQKENLKGFIFSARHLMEILTENRSGETPDEVAFLFGQEGKFSDGFFNKNGNIHIVAVGLNQKRMLNTQREGTGDPSDPGPSVYDKADSCPPFTLTE